MKGRATIHVYIQRTIHTMYTTPVNNFLGSSSLASFFLRPPLRVVTACEVVTLEEVVVDAELLA